jgi:predicted ATPase
MLFEALLHWLATLARRQPVLVVFEDAHWIDPTSRELLDLTIDRVAQRPFCSSSRSAPSFNTPGVVNHM